MLNRSTSTSLMSLFLMCVTTKFDQIPQCGLTEKSLSYQSEHLTFCLEHYYSYAALSAYYCNYVAACIFVLQM